MENTAPNFSKQLEDIEVKIGKEATLECSISGRPEPRVAWFKGGNKIEPSGDYQIARDKAGLLSLYITNVEVGDAGVYTVKATNDAGEAKSFATLTVTTTREADAQTATKPKTKAPHFIQLFADQTTKKGKRVAFECIVSGLPRPEIQWNFNDTPVRPWDYQISSAGERHWLKIPMVGPRHHGKYDITAENDEGKAVCTAQLIVTDDSGRVIPDSVSEEKKSVTTQKTTVTESKVTKVSSSSDVPSSLESHKVLRALNYTYKKVGDEPPEESTIGQRTEEHELSPVERREVKKLEGLAQSSLRRKPKAPMFKEPVEGVQMEAGNPLKLSAVVEGEPEPDIRWYRNDAELSGASTGVTVSYHDRKAELVVEKATSGDSGVYKCTAENPFGNASSSADVLVKASEEIAPAFKQPIEAVTISEGETAVFVAVITGKPTPAVTWYKNNTKLDEEQTNVNVSFSRGRAMLRLVKTNESDSGRYKCVATNSVGNVSCSRTLTVNPATALFVPPCFTNPLTNVSCGEGKTAVFRAKLEGKPEPSVRWFKDGAEIRPDSGKIKIDLKADEVKLTIPDTSVKDSGRYTCTVSNMAGTATSTANLNVQGSVMPPQFTKRLASMFVKSGDKVTMEVEVTAKPEPKVYWFKDDELLSNSPDFRISCRGNKHRLVIAEAFPDDSGKYAVVAKNDSGEAKSAADCIVEDESSQVGGGREVLKPEKEMRSHIQRTGEMLSLTSCAPSSKEIFMHESYSWQDQWSSSAVKKWTTEPKSGPPRWKPVKPPETPGNRAVICDTSHETTSLSSFERISASGVEEANVRESEEYQMSGPLNSTYRIKDPEPIYESVLISSDSEYCSQSKSSSILSKWSRTSGLSRTNKYSKHRKKEVCVEEEPVIGSKVTSPMFIRQLKDVTVNEGDQAVFECQIIGCPPPDVRWYHNDRIIQPDVVDYISNYDNGIATLIIPQVFQVDCGSFTCTVTNVVCSKSSTANLRTNTAATFGRSNQTI